VGDMEELPFPDETFRKACCLNAFHHVSNTLDALREIKRVLTPDGIVFFAEPGVGHASRPTSIAASRNYGVLENDVLIDDFMSSCLAAGFADVRLHPISHIIPLFELDRQQWRHWSKYTASTRPFRAVEKIWRAALEFAGVRKKGVLFEEAFAIRLLRELQQTIEQHPVVTAHRAPFVKPELVLDCAELDLVTAPATVPAWGQALVRVSIANLGTTTWSTSPEAGEVRFGVQLLGNDGDVLDRDYARHRLPAPILPGGRCELAFNLIMPAPDGRYQLKFDLVREGVHWFELTGSSPLVHLVQVVHGINGS
jgi:hypothetical protein